VLEELRAGRQFLLQVREALAKGEMPGKLHEANEVASLSAPVTVEQVLAWVDVEAGASFLMQGTGSDELGANRGRSSAPVVPLQVREQRNALFQLFQILTHGVYRRSSIRVRISDSRYQARMVGERKNPPVSEAQGPKPKDSQKAKHSRPRQAQRAVSELLPAILPLLYRFKSASQKRKSRRGIQAVAPAA